MSKKEKLFRWAMLALCEVFTLFTIGLMIVRHQFSRLPVALVHMGTKGKCRVFKDGTSQCLA